MIRILLAEDEEAMRTYLARALENAGYKVVAVDRGTAAIPLLERETFDLLLSDIVMPEMDGIELAQRCAEISPETKVMFITGFAAVTLKASQEAPPGQGPVQAVPPARPGAGSRSHLRFPQHRAGMKESA